MNALARENEARRDEFLAQREVVVARRAASPPPSFDDLPAAALRRRITEALRERSGRPDLVCDVDSIDRSKLGADFAVRVPALLAEGPKEYIQTHVPWIAEALGGPALADTVEEVQRKGIYVNVRLTDRAFLAAVQTIIDLGEEYGHSDAWADRSQLVDYSSPNVAKALHAGHFRSTIIGHVLGNLYEACGATVFRVNHINDFGGFGFMLEGLRRFEPLFPEGMADNDRLLEVYGVWRALERAVKSGSGMPATEEDRERVERYFPEADDLRAAYDDLVDAADARFARLEEGDPEEVDLWKRMVAWSLASFEPFYSSLRVDIDFVIGESFYLDAGNAVVDEAIADGRAYVLTQERIDEETAALDRAAEAEEITPQVRDKAVSLLEKDLGAVVVPLPGGERYVVRRSDGRSIYATRDIGAIKLRRELFDPTDMTYVVGQEQRVHFARLFAAARVLGLATEDVPRFKHISFGFYVDADSGKKLSSRESVTGFNELLAAAVKHFRAKSAEDATMSEEELDEAGQQLAVGSVAFNDLKRDMKGSVPIPRGDLAPIVEDFEKSGGPYVVYAATRARAILRRYGKPVPGLDEVGDFELNDQERLLIARLLELPEKIVRAADEDNPAVLVRHLLDIASVYNSYYANAPVLEGDKANLARLMITWAAHVTLRNGLRVCHVETPPKI